MIAAILVTRYRRQAESAESKSRDLRLVYELQLEREIAARIGVTQMQVSRLLSRILGQLRDDVGEVDGS